MLKTFKKSPDVRYFVFYLLFGWCLFSRACVLNHMVGWLVGRKPERSATVECCSAPQGKPLVVVGRRAPRHLLSKVGARTWLLLSVFLDTELSKPVDEQWQKSTLQLGPEEIVRKSFSITTKVQRRRRRQPTDFWVNSNKNQSAAATSFLTVLTNYWPHR